MHARAHLYTAGGGGSDGGGGANDGDSSPESVCWFSTISWRRQQNEVKAKERFKTFPTLWKRRDIKIL